MKTIAIVPVAMVLVFGFLAPESHAGSGDKFLGNWVLQEFSEKDCTPPYTMTISKLGEKFLLLPTSMTPPGQLNKPESCFKSRQLLSYKNDCIVLTEGGSEVVAGCMAGKFLILSVKGTGYKYIRK